MYGDRLSDKEIQNFIDLDHRVVDATNPAGKGVELDLLPWIRFIPGVNKHIKILNAIKDDIEECFRERYNYSSISEAFLLDVLFQLLLY